MGSAFTEHEKQIIRNKLLAAATQAASTVGMKNTSVQSLAHKAGISKGAFYQFFESKEHLFWLVLEDMHVLYYQVARDALENAADAKNSVRAGDAVLAVIRTMLESDHIRFLAEDVQGLLRKLSPQIIEEHFAADRMNIGAMLGAYGFSVRLPLPVVSDIVHTFFVLVTHQDDFESDIMDVITPLVRGFCATYVDEAGIPSI